MDLSILTQSSSVNSAKAANALRNESTETTEPDTGTGTSSSTSSDVSEQFDTFLNLLTAQIRNQDPLAPLDSTQFVEQLATFSNLELQAKNNQILESIASMLAQQLATQNTSDV